MTLIIVTLIGFAAAAVILYVGTEMLPKWIFLRRHRVHKNALGQFDMSGQDSPGDAQANDPSPFD